MRYCYGAEVTMKGPNDTTEDSASPTPTPTPVTTDKVVGEEFDLRIRVFGSVPNFQATSTTPEEDNNNPWVGIYKDGQTPGTDSSTDWEWISESFRYGEPLGPFSVSTFTLEFYLPLQPILTPIAYVVGRTGLLFHHNSCRQK